MTEHNPRPEAPVGVHRDVPFGVYTAWDAASNSALGHLQRSPAHLRAYLEEPPADTEALALGRAVHAAILEPELFARSYVRGVDGDGRTKAVKDARAQLALDYPRATVLRPAEYDTCIRMRDSVHAHGRAAGMLAGDGACELSAVWNDPATGVRCKARFDRHSIDLPGGVIVDVKTTRDASRRAFERSIFAFGYHRQAAMYLEAARVLDVPARHFVLIAIEKEPPYAVAVYRLTEGAIDAGAEQMRALLARYRVCRETGEWPGYPDEVQDIALPPWAWAQAAEEAEEARAA